MAPHHLEYCGRCGCPLDHIGKRCAHSLAIRNAEGDEITQLCTCKEGVRTDVFMNRQLSELLKGVIALNQNVVELCETQSRNLMVICAASGFEIVEEPGEQEGAINVVVRKRQVLAVP